MKKIQIVDTFKEMDNITFKTICTTRVFWYVWKLIRWSVSYVVKMAGIDKCISSKVALFEG